MKWVKKGLIFKPDGRYEWMVSHAQVPISDKVSDDVLRIYYGPRDKFNRTVTAYIEVEADNPKHVLYVHEKPVLGLGETGCFDDSGAMPCCIVNHKGAKYLFYTGWNLAATVPYRLSIGLAVSHDNGQTFTRLYDGPVLDRIYSEPHWCAGPWVIVENGRWRMWYLSCIKWEAYKGKLEPYYNIKYADSSDGINWKREGIVSIELKSPDEAALSRPYVVKTDDGVYKMWYGYRGVRDFRTNKGHSYRIGYAESFDGIKWTRKDEFVDLNVSRTGWDSIMVTYPNLYEHKGKTYMLYNGNGFGRSGFGYAVMSEMSRKCNSEDKLDREG
ncbi:MAG: hypothetical protein ACFFCW_09800 [Candidatus Hodarchaeota archaeon]